MDSSSQALPPVGTMFRRAFASTWRAIVSMPVLFASAGVGVVAVAFIAKFLGANPIQAGKLIIGGLTATEGLAVLAGTFLTYFAQSVFLAPVAVAMHRFIIRGETTKGIVSIAPGHTRLFLLWLMLIQTVRILSLLPVALAPAQELRVPLVILVYAVAIAIAVAGVRICLLFPSAAIGAPSASFVGRAAASWNATRGHFWYIFAVGLLIGLVVTIPTSIVVTSLAMGSIVSGVASGGAPPKPDFVLEMFTSGPVLVLTALQYVVLSAAAAAGLSWIYRALVEGSADAAPSQAPGDAGA
jgi:hypothetical protein